MFAELIFAILAIIIISVDSFYKCLVCCGLLISTVFMVCYFFNSSINLNKYDIVYLVTKIWLFGYYCFGLTTSLFRFFKCFGRTQQPLNFSKNSFCGIHKSLDKEIDTLVFKISKFYISSWYEKLSEDDEFLLRINSTIKATLFSISEQLLRIDNKKVSYICMQIYLNFFSHFMKLNAQGGKEESFKMKHWAMKDKEIEWCYLQSVISSLLDLFSPTEDEQALQSRNNPVLHNVVVEILTAKLLHPLLCIISDPSYINTLIIKILACFIELEEISKFIAIRKISGENGKSLDVLFPSISKMEKIYDTNTCVESLEDKACNYAKCKEFCKEDCFANTEKNSVPFPSNDLKSSSSVNLCRLDFPASDDTIQRSRSVDYINHFPELKALNKEDYNVLHSENNTVFVTLKCDVSPSTGFIEQAEEAVELEVPTLFRNIKIINTYQENNVSLMPFTIYVIQYTGLYHDASSSSAAPEFVEQNMCVSRRFREFLALQTKLENDAALYPYLGNIKGPSKGLALPFSNLDKKNIAERRSFLEQYLNQLCSYPRLCQSSELQEFLGYGLDEVDGIVQKMADGSLRRINKILKRGVDKIKIDMQSSPFEEDELFHSDLIEDPSSEIKFQEHLINYSSREPDIAEHARNFIGKQSFGFDSEDFLGLEFSQTSPIPTTFFNFKTTKSCKCPLLDNKFVSIEENAFGVIIFKLIAVALKLEDLVVNDLLSSLKISIYTAAEQLYSAAINRFLVQALNNLADDDLTVLLHLLHTSLWPDDKSRDQSSEYYKVETTIKFIEGGFAQNVTNNFKRNFLDVIKVFVQSIQSQEINKCLWFHIFDIILDNVCKEDI